MSEAVSALDGASFEGIATIREAGLRGMITLRGDLADTGLQSAVNRVTGVEFPAQGAVNCADDRGLGWMSPDELLVLVPYGEAGTALASIETALKGTHVLAANVSDARAVFAVEGAQAREVLAKLSPADLSPAAFQPGQLRRTRLAQAPAAFWMRDDAAFEVICFRSVAGYVFDLLSAAAVPGSEVGHF